MKLISMSEGFVSEQKAGVVAVSSRCAVTREGHVLCCFMVQSALGINDFVPTLAESRDGGITWSERGPVWPELAGVSSLFMGLSRSPTGELFLYGTRTPIDAPGESFWSEASGGLKQNDLVWARSSDSGRSWSRPAVIPMPQAGAAEAPGPMCITRHGRWVVCYAPYPTFDPDVQVDRGHLVLLYSDDEGASWRHTSMIRFAEPESGGAEAWVVELADGRLLGTCWHLSLTDAREFQNPCAISADAGATWQPPVSTGILGQSTALAPLDEGGALLVYNQRKHGDIGVWLAGLRLSGAEVGVEWNQPVWRAELATQTASSGQHDDWCDFAFGEPSVAVVPDGSLLVTLWCLQPSGRGIRYVKLGFGGGANRPDARSF
jgi:hypothetical protein